MAKGRLREWVDDVVIPFYFGPNRTGPSFKDLAWLASLQFVGSLVATIALVHWWRATWLPQSWAPLRAWIVVLLAGVVVLPSLRAGVRLVRFARPDTRVLQRVFPLLSLLCAGLCFASIVTAIYMIRGGSQEFVVGAGGLLAFFLGIPGVSLLLEWRAARKGSAIASWDAGIVAFIALAQFALGWAHLAPLD